MVDLRTPLSIRSAFRFPLQSDLARRELLIGAALLFVPFVGWLLNMGHRIAMVHTMQHGRPAWPAWRRPAALLRHGLITFLGMVEYYAPAAMVAWLAWHRSSALLGCVGCILFIAATLAIPGFMSHYCVSFDAREILDPFRALRRAIQGGRAYWHAWGIALLALLISPLGLLAFGVGFLVTSVWFWQVAGYSFANAFSSRFELASAGAPDLRHDAIRPA